MRGKHGRRAELRRDAQEVDQTIATYQRKVAQLTAEVKDLSEKLATQNRVAKQAEKTLRAERDAGVAPQVQALTLALRAATQERDKARRHAAEVQQTWHRVTGRLVDHFTGVHGVTRMEALEEAMKLSGENVTIAGHVAGAAANDREAAVRIQRARGERS